MRLIAKRDFRNVGNAIEIENPIHPDHIHKGATFVVGQSDDTPYEKLSRQDKEFVALLNAADCLADGADPAIVAKVNAELARDKRKAAEAEKAKPAGK